MAKAKLITGKRARLVVDLILKQGYVTTEDLKDQGYDHPPRAIKDVTDQGLPLVRSWTKSREGRKIARYQFGDPKEIRHDRLGGRQVFSQKFKKDLLENYGNKCFICSATLEARYLQIDHRVPYEVAGESDPGNKKAYMPLCGSCNRAKSWSCEHCENWQTKKDSALCLTCYWASPDDYAHVALVQMRRIDITWNEQEVSEFDKLQHDASKTGEHLPEFVKNALRNRKRGD